MIDIFFARPPSLPALKSPGIRPLGPYRISLDQSHETRESLFWYSLIQTIVSFSLPLSRSVSRCSWHSKRAPTLCGWKWETDRIRTTSLIYMIYQIRVRNINIYKQVRQLYQSHALYKPMKCKKSRQRNIERRRRRRETRLIGNPFKGLHRGPSRRVLVVRDELRGFKRTI